MKIGIVSKIYGTYYNLFPYPRLHPERRGKLRGRLRLEKTKPENHQLRHLIMVGDRVHFQEEDSEVIIESLLPRKNLILRANNFQVHALGANLDYALLVSSLAQPEVRFTFVDRFLASCKAGQVEPVLLFTKTDLLKKTEWLLMTEHYRYLGYPVFRTNLNATEPCAEFQALQELLQDKTTLLAGRSGTGKSTLINRLLEQDIQKTGNISRSTQKGRHTTTNSTLFIDRKRSALYIDTPGVKEWGIQHLTRSEIYDSFPEMESEEECRFRDCDHSSGSEGCVVQAQLNAPPLENSEKYCQKLYIIPERRKSLLAMLESLKYPDKIRTGDYIKPTGRIVKKCDRN